MTSIAQKKNIDPSKLEEILHSAASLEKKAKNLLQYLRGTPGRFVEVPAGSAAHEWADWLVHKRWLRKVDDLGFVDMYEVAPFGRRFNDAWTLMTSADDDA